MSGEKCACSRVRLKKEKVGDGIIDSWICDLCGAEFVRTQYIDYQLGILEKCYTEVFNHFREVGSKVVEYLMSLDECKHFNQYVAEGGEPEKHIFYQAAKLKKIMEGWDEGK